MAPRMGQKQESEHAKPLRKETNILVFARLNDLKYISHINIWLAMATVVYFGVNVVCAVLNSFPRGDEEGAVTSDQLFHNTEFGATFLFAIVENLAIVYSPERQFEAEWLLRFLVFWNIALSFIPALMVFINLEKFEVPSHEIEYGNGCAMALVDMLMALQLINSYRRDKAKKLEARQAGGGVEVSVSEAPAKTCCKYLVPVLFGVIPISISVAQLAVYNGMGVSDDGERYGEQAAHYLEFAFEMISSLITFWFCMDNKNRVDSMRLDIMLAAPGDEIFVMDTEEASRVMLGTGLQRLSIVPNVPTQPDASHSAHQRAS